MSSLAAARADNFYYPPEWRPEMGGISKFQGSKGKNQYEQYGIIRFELPFDGWCIKCNQHLSKGLRFNAKKEKEGKYFSTQIYRFEMKCYQCANPITIRTDPKNNTYDYATGIRKMEHDYIPEDDDHVVVLDDGMDNSSQGHHDSYSNKQSSLETVLDSAPMTLEQKNNPILRLETDIENRVKVLSAQERMSELIAMKNSHSKEDYDNNAKLRKLNRDKKRKVKDMYEEGRKLGLINVALLDHKEEDQQTAKLVKFNEKEQIYKQKEKLKRVSIMSQSIFSSHPSSDSSVSISTSTSSSSKERQSNQEGHLSQFKVTLPNSHQKNSILTNRTIEDRRNKESKMEGKEAANIRRRNQLMIQKVERGIQSNHFKLSNLSNPSKDSHLSSSMVSIHPKSKIKD